MNIRLFLLGVASLVIFGQAAFPVLGRAATIGGGTTEGIFLNPTPTCPPAACTGIGTNTIFWGTGDESTAPNGLAFAGRGFSVEQGQTFTLGLLQYQNSSTDNNIDRVDLRFQTRSPVAEFNQAVTENLSITSTLNFGVDANADADFVHFTNSPGFGSFRVHEDTVGTVELLARFSPLESQGFGTAGGGTILPFVLVGFGDVVTPNTGFTSPSTSSPSAIPEPTTMLLLASGLGALAFRRRDRRPG